MVVRIDEIKEAFIYNKHTNMMYKHQKLWEIKIKDKNKLIVLDMLAQKDITNVDYLEIKKTNKTKIKTVFIDEFEEA